MLRVAALISIWLNSTQVLTMEKELNERVLGYMYLCVRLRKALSTHIKSIKAYVHAQVPVSSYLFVRDCFCIRCPWCPRPPRGNRSRPHACSDTWIITSMQQMEHQVHLSISFNPMDMTHKDTQRHTKASRNINPGSPKTVKQIGFWPKTIFFK